MVGVCAGVPGLQSPNRGVELEVPGHHAAACVVWRALAGADHSRQAQGQRTI